VAYKGKKGFGNFENRLGVRGVEPPPVQRGGFCLGCTPS